MRQRFMLLFLEFIRQQYHLWIYECLQQFRLHVLLL